jgi:signal transduction histidine kinase
MKTTIDFRTVFVVTAIVLVGGLLWYSNVLVQRLADKEERLVAFWASVYEYIGTASQDNGSETEASFLVQHLIIQKPPIIQVPAIVTDSLGRPMFDNLILDSTLTSAQRQQEVARALEEMKTNPYPPITIEYLPGQKHLVYYRETDELNKLRYYPYITILLLSIFILVVFAYFYSVQQSQQNKVWVGLAKETAHQLGTPISGLLAWSEVLKLKFEDTEDEEIGREIERDVRHLETIADRFSKIGSIPDLHLTPVSPTLTQAVEYVRSRAGRSGKVTISYEDHLPPETQLYMVPTLFAWVIENLVKNALDALVNRTGTITVRARKEKASVVIEVEDTGKGIARRHIRSVFKPGFTTKQRGWGLGLSLSKRIVEQFHRGRISIRKTEVGKGTTFQIVLPLPRQ